MDLSLWLSCSFLPQGRVERTTHRGELERNAASSAFTAGGRRLKQQIEPFPATGSPRIKKLASLTEVTGLEKMQPFVIFSRGPSQKPRSQKLKRRGRK